MAPPQPLNRPSPADAGSAGGRSGEDKSSVARAPAAHIHNPPMELGEEAGGGNVVELDHRSCGSIDVSLFWDRCSNTLFVQVIDWHDGEDFSIPVEAASAVESFHHPYAYAPAFSTPA